MAKSDKDRKGGSAESNESEGTGGNVNEHGMNGGNGAGTGNVQPGLTGRSLVLLDEGAVETGLQSLSNVTGLNVARTRDFTNNAPDAETLATADAIFFDNLAVAVVNTPPELLRSLQASGTTEQGVLAVEPERIVYAIDENGAAVGAITAPVIAPPVPLFVQPSIAGQVQGEYLAGYRDAVNHLVDQLLPGGRVAANGAVRGEAAVDEELLTWGLQATRVAESQYSGNGVRVAVLDTGLDLGHPDFAGRRIVAQSFVPSQSAQDGHGHGTHCVGTALGPKVPGQLPRYGVAYGAEIYVGKVLSNQGSGTDAGILAGISWAITQGCQVVSMSLGAAVQPGQSFSLVYEILARRALAAGTLIIAAAGNESMRPNYVAPVGHPANCPSIMAVAAVDPQLSVTYFSCGGINAQGGQVDIAGPGLQIRSSWPRPVSYNTISGTSMATPHVAGIAALYAEANPAIRGGALGWLLLQSARRLNSSARDTGAGLVQAP